MSDRFKELAAFVAVAETGAFKAAAKKLGQSPPATTRHVSALEARLGVQLLTRTTRKVSPTEAGARLLGEAATILAALETAEAAASGAHETPRGHLRVTAPVLFGERHIAPALRALIDAHPALTACALFVDRNVDLIEEGIDVAVRIGPLADSTLVARRVGAVRRMVVAAPSYLATAAPLQSPEDLARHRIIHPSAISQTAEWVFNAAGRRRAIRLDAALALSSNVAAIEAAIEGWGVTRVLSYQVAEAIADGRLVELLADADDQAMPIHLVHAEGRRASAKIRVFVETVAERLKAAKDGKRSRGRL